ncbi:MAG: AI-2E family transporter, partial [Desulfomonile sp.]|nr:AI-2E family transporter [Desulfomonile sp.]
MTATGRRTLIRLAAAAAFVFVLVWLMSALESVTTMVMVAFFLAYLLDPAANRLEKWRVPRSLGSLLLIVLGLLVMVLFFLFLVPSVVREVSDFAARAPKYTAVLKNRLLSALQEYQLAHPEEWDQAMAWVYEQTRQLLPEVRRFADPLARFVGTVFKSTLG